MTGGEKPIVMGVVDRGAAGRRDRVHGWGLWLLAAVEEGGFVMAGYLGIGMGTERGKGGDVWFKGVGDGSGGFGVAIVMFGSGK